MPTKWVRREGQIMLSTETKFWSIQEPLDKKSFTWIQKNFQQRKCSNDKFERKIWSFVSQFALVFLQTKGMGFCSQGLGGGGTRTPLDPLDTDSPILACSRLSDCGESAKRYEQKKN